MTQDFRIGADNPQCDRAVAGAAELNALNAWPDLRIVLLDKPLGFSDSASICLPSFTRTIIWAKLLY